MPNAALFLPHFRHALQAFQSDANQLATETKIDLVLTLCEAFRFPGMQWKKFATERARFFACDLADPYLDACIAESQSVVARIAGDARAANRLCDVNRGGPSPADPRMQSAIGRTTIQRSLDCIQFDNLPAAEKLLQDWSPCQGSPSPMEDVVLFRKYMLLGKIMRFRGKFNESLQYLHRARETAERQQKDLSFDEDLPVFACELADALRELDDPKSAETHLRTEIARLETEGVLSKSSSLELSLAEALFAQGRHEEAEQLALVIDTRVGLLKLEKLRLQITRAKIRHVASDNNGALHYWNKALDAIKHFPLTNGGTTRVIVLSICDILGDAVLVQKSGNLVASLDTFARPGGVQYWFAGLRHWSQYLESQDRGRVQLAAPISPGK